MFSGDEHERRKNSGNQSLIRGLRLIDLLSHYPNGCPLAKLAELSGLNKSTVHRLLQGLQQEGFIQAATTAGSLKFCGIGVEFRANLRQPLIFSKFDRLLGL